MTEADMISVTIKEGVEYSVGITFVLVGYNGCG
jgi:hypothetical protein